MSATKMHILSDVKVRAAEPRESDYTINDGGGLYLFIRTYGKKEWFFRYTSPLTGKRRKQSLGRFPDVLLQQARKAAANQRATLDQKQDPLFEAEKQIRRQVKEHTERKQLERHTVEAVFQMWKLADLQNRKDHGTDTERAFVKDVFPVIRRKPISEVTR